MSTFWKVLAVVVVIVLIIWGVRAVRNPGTTSGTSSATTTVSSNSSNVVSSRDNSNASLNQDLESVDAQLNVMDKDSAQVDQSLQDKPVTQTE